MTVATGEVVRASARFRDNQGSDCVNVYTFRTDFATPQDELDVFNGVDAYLTSVYTDIDSVLDNGFAPFDLKVDVVQFTGGDWLVTQNVGFGSWGTGITPTATGDPLPPGNCGLVKMFTGLGKHTGKKFVGGFVDTVLDVDGNLTTSFTTTLTTAFLKLLTPHVIAAGNDLITVILDQLDGTIRDVIGIGATDVVAYQRRRRPGTGS